MDSIFSVNLLNSKSNLRSQKLCFIAGRASTDGNRMNLGALCFSPSVTVLMHWCIKAFDNPE